MIMTPKQLADLLDSRDVSSSKTTIPASIFVGEVEDANFPHPQDALRITWGTEVAMLGAQPGPFPKALGLSLQNEALTRDDLYHPHYRRGLTFTVTPDLASGRMVDFIASLTTIGKLNNSELTSNSDLSQYNRGLNPTVRSEISAHRALSHLRVETSDVPFDARYDRLANLTLVNLPIRFIQNPYGPSTAPDVGTSTPDASLRTVLPQNPYYDVMFKTVADAVSPLARIVFPKTGVVAYMLLSAISEPTCNARNNEPGEVTEMVITFHRARAWKGVVVTHIFTPVQPTNIPIDYAVPGTTMYSVVLGEPYGGGHFVTESTPAANKIVDLSSSSGIEKRSSYSMGSTAGIDPAV